MLVACSQYKSKSILQGTITDSQYKKVYLLQQISPTSWEMLDSTSIVDNHFMFADLPSEYNQLFVQLDNTIPFVVFVDKGTIELAIPAQNVHETKVKGSSLHDEYMMLQDSIDFLLHQRLLFYKDAIVAQNDGRQTDATILQQKYIHSKNNVFHFLQKQKGANPTSAPLLYIIKTYKPYFTDTEYRTLSASLE